MINSEWYPVDFDDYQCQALDAAAEMQGTEDLSELAPYIKAIRNGRYQFLPDVYNARDLGYANSEMTGLNDALAVFFDWEAFGESLNCDYNGAFTCYGWIAF